MTLLAADLTIVGASLAAAVLGAFGGFSRTIAFAVALSVAVAAASVLWPASAEWLDSTWVRVAAVFFLSLILFGGVRSLTRRLAGKMLAQPADAIFGFLVSFAVAFAVSLGAAWALNYFGLLAEGDSVLLAEVLRYVG